MAKTPFTQSLPPEHAAQLLKAREHSLGNTDDSLPAETNIGWDIQLKAQPTSVHEAEHATSLHGQADSSIAPVSQPPLPPVGAGSGGAPDAHLGPASVSDRSLPEGNQSLMQREGNTALAPDSMAPREWGGYTPVQPAENRPMAGTGNGGLAAVSHSAQATGASSGSATHVAAFQTQGVTSGQVKEDNLLQTQGKLHVSGHPQGLVQWAIANHQGQLGALDIDQNGQWHYLLDNANSKVQALGEGQQVTERFLVIATDASGVSRAVHLLVQVNGGNDRAVIAGTTIGSVTEESQLHTSGRLSVTDADTGQAEFMPITNSIGLHGQFAIAADGSWDYRLDPRDPAVDALKHGEQLTDTFTVTSKDGTPQQITVTIHGSDDKAVITGTAVGTVTETSQPGFSGKLVITDPDAGQAEFVPLQQAASSHGIFSVAADGSWSYHLNGTDAAVQALRPGDAPLVDTLTVTSKDGGSTQTLSVFIHGNNDAPTLQAARQLTHEDDPLLHGRLIGHDVDRTDTLVYGTPNVVPGFMLHADGSYTFDPSNPAWQHIAAGEQHLLDITVTVTDETGARATQTLQITVTGTNDLPMMQMLPPMATFEGSPVMRGKLTAIDIDTHDTLTFHSTQPIAGFTLNADGSYSFDPNDPAYNQLAFGQKQIVTIPVEVVDSAGGVVASHIQITVTGTNDTPTLAVMPPRHVDEGATAIHGQLIANDPDAGDTLTYSAGQHVAGFTLNADGSYHFDPADSAYNYLPAGQKAIITVPVIVTDSHGGSDVQQVQITVTGTNDVPIVGGIDHAMGAVAGATGGRIHVAGQLTALDLDQGESHFQPQLIAGTYGVLEIMADGHWTYTADATRPVLAQMPANGQLPEHFTVRTADGTTHDIDVVIKGSNTPAIFAGVASAVVTEDQTGSVSQHLSVSDPNAGENAFTPVSNQATHYGHFTLAATGDWSYTLDNANSAVQALTQGKTLTDSIIVGSVDGTPTVVTVNIMGADDRAIISGTHTGDVIEDNVGTGTVLNASGQLSVTDPDAGQEHFVAMHNIAGDHGYGSFGIDAQGHWTYSADNTQASVQALRDGETVTDSLNVMTADGTQQIITVTLTGTQDQAVIGGVDTGTLTEDRQSTPGKPGPISTNGQLTVTDVDAGEARFPVQRGTGAQGYGTFALLPDGRWQYSAQNDNPAIQALKAGDTLTDSFAVHSADGTTHTVTITIQGSNDAPTLQAQTQAVSEDGARLSGHMVATDVDTGDTQAFSIAHPVAGFTFNADGSYSFNPSDAAYQYLAAGQTQTLTIPVTVTDSVGATATQNLTITVTGSNDGPTVVRLTDAVPEDAPHHTLNLLSGASDVDGDTLGVTGIQYTVDGKAISGLPPGVSLAPDGHTLRVDTSDNAYQHLAPGQTLDITVSYRVTDGHGGEVPQTATITITGTNDAPTFYGKDSFNVVEDAPGYHGSLVGHAVDTGDSMSFSTTATVAGFTLQPDGHYSFDPGHNAYQHLKAGETQIITIPVTVTDQTGAHTTRTDEIQITLTGSNDGATVSGTASGTVTEDTGVGGGKITTAGSLSVTDVDTGEAHFIAQTGIAGTYGSFSIDEQGRWTYSADNTQTKVQALKDGETATDSVTVMTADGTRQIITVTLRGTQDQAVITGTDTGAVTEDQQVDSLHTIHCGGTLQVADTDAGEAVFAVQHGASSQGYGSFILGPSGGWTYSADNTNPAIQSLKAGETLTDSFTVHSADGTTHTVTVTMQGTNDAPVLQAQAQAVTEDGATLTGHMAATDVDAGDTLAFSMSAPVAGFVLNADGSYSFDPAHAAYQHLAAGQTQDVVIPVTVTDSAGAISTQSLTITVTGSNDAPSVSATTTAPADLGATSEDASRTFTQADLLHMVGAADVDNHAALSISAVNIDAHYGSFTHLPNGDWAFTPAANVSGTDLPVTVTISDGTVTTTGKAVLDITAVADRPVSFLAESVSTDFATPTITDHSGRWAFQDPSIWGWKTDSASGVEHGAGVAYGDTSGGNIGVVELEGAANEASNLYRDIHAQAGAHYQLAFDLSGRTGASGNSADVEVLWEGQVIATIHPAENVFGFHHYSYDVVATGDSSRIELRAVTRDGMGPVVDNLAMTFGSLSGVEDSPIPIKLNAHLVDTDGSEVLGASIRDLPVGFTVSDGTHTVTVATAGQTLELPGWDLDHLSVVAPANFAGAADIVIAVTATETANGNVASVDYPIHMTWAGVNDAPVMAPATAVAVEDGSAITGQLSATDPDSGDTFTYSSSAAVAGFTLSADGSYRFDPSHADYQHLAAGQTQTLAIPVTVTDSRGATAQQSFVITLTGTDDAPQLSIAPLSASEDGTVLTGRLAATDADTSDIHSYSTSATVDGFVLNADGSYTFTPSQASYQHLAVGQTETLSIPVTVNDGHGGTAQQNLVITLTGTNDAPVIGSGVAAVAAPVAVAGHDMTQGGGFETLAKQWVADSGSPYGQVGLVIMQEAGLPGMSRLQQVLAHRVPAGEALDKYIYSTADIVLTGPNGQQRVLAGHTLDRDVAATAQVRELVDWVKQGAGYHVEFRVATGAAAKMLLLDDATYSSHAGFHKPGFSTSSVPDYYFRADSGHGVTLTDHLTFQPDGAPTAAATPAATPEVTSGELTEDSAPTLTGTLHASDVDAGDALSFSIKGDGHGTWGDATVDPKTGEWHYTLNAHAQTLGAGESVQEVITIVVTDQNGATVSQDITLTVKGSEDAAVIASGPAGSATEDSPAAAQGVVSLSDIDRDDTPSFVAKDTSAPYHGTYGSLTLDAAGHWTYTLDSSNPAVQAANIHTAMTDTVWIDSADGGHFAIRVAIQGTDDAPTLTEEAVLKSTPADTPRTYPTRYLTLYGADVDNDANTDLSAQHLSVDPAQGTVVDNGDGTFTFTPAHGFTGMVELHYELVDKDGAASAVVAHLGVATGYSGALNSSPTAGAPADLGITPVGQAVEIRPEQLLATSHDPDGDPLALHDLTVNVGTLQGPDLAGHYLYTPPAGYHGPVQFGFAITDRPGSPQSSDNMAHATLEVVESNANIGGADRATTPDDDSAVTGVLTVTDADAGQGHFVAQTDVAGQYGKFSLAADGHWTYTPDARADALAVGVTQHDTFAVRSADGTQHDVTVTVTGSDEAPVVTATTAAPADLGATAEDTPRTFTQAELLRLAGASDGDVGDTLSISAVTVDAQYGAFSKQANGDWLFTPAANVSHNDIPLTLTVSDGHATTTAHAQLDIGAVADAPSLQVSASGAASRLTSADFSQSAHGINFDLTSTAYQSPAQDAAAGYYEVTSATGGAGDDTFRLSALRAGTSYTVNGGSGHNVLDLSAYRADQVRIDTQTSTATVTLPGGGVSTIHYSHIGDIKFSTSVFDGTPHAVEPVTGTWVIEGTHLSVAGGVSSQVALIDYAGSLQTDYTLAATVNAHANSAFYTNGGIVFDYVDANNYKMAVLRAGQGGWTIEQVASGQWSQLESIHDPTMATKDVDHLVELRVHGSVAELWSGGVMKTSHDFGSPLNDGRFGVISDQGQTDFQLAMRPSDWAPSAPNIETRMDVSDPALLTENVLAQAKDPEGHAVTLSHFDAISAHGGQVTSNGDGTFRYVPAPGFIGTDSFSYEVTDGVNHTTATIRVNVADLQTVTHVSPGDAFTLNVAPSTPDRDGSEHLQVQLAGLPDGAVVTDGAHTATIGHGQALDVSDWALDTLKVTPPASVIGNYVFRVESRAIDGSSESSWVSKAVRVELHPGQPYSDAIIAGDDTLTTDEDSRVSGVLTITDPTTAEAHFTAQTDVDGKYGKFSLAADGHWTYTPDDRADALHVGQQAQDIFTVRSADGGMHQVTVALTGSNDGPTVTAGDTPHAADLGATAEDTPKSYTEVDLLRLIGAHDADSGDTLHITSATLDAQYGTLTKQTDGTWLFTPAANAHHNDIPLTVTVSDGHATTTAHAQLDITPVTDAATPGLSILADQQVMDFGHGDPQAYARVPAVHAGAAMTSATAEITFVLDPHNPPSNAGVLLNYNVPGGTGATQNLITLWNAHDLHFSILGANYGTGVNLLDGKTHRITLAWDGTTGDMWIYDNGHEISHQTGVATGQTLPGGGSFLVGTRTNTGGTAVDNPADYTSGLSAGGRVFAATLVDHVVPGVAVAAGAVSHENHGVLANIVAQGGAIVDTVSGHPADTGPHAHIVTVPVDVNAGTLPAGALLHITPIIDAPADGNDHVTGVELAGLMAGTVLDDGHGHTHTVTGSTDIVDIHDWNLGSLTAQLPAGQRSNMQLELRVTTTGPDGTTALSVTHTGVMLDPAQPMPAPHLVGRSLVPDDVIPDTGPEATDDHSDLGFVAYHGTETDSGVAVDSGKRVDVEQQSFDEDRVVSGVHGDQANDSSAGHFAESSESQNNPGSVPLAESTHASVTDDGALVLHAGHDLQGSDPHVFEGVSNTVIPSHIADSSPLHDYLQFSDFSTAPTTPHIDHNSPDLAEYLHVANVTDDSALHTQALMPPLEVLLPDVDHSVAAPEGHEHQAVHDSSVVLDIPELPQDNHQQHQD